MHADSALLSEYFIRQKTNFILMVSKSKDEMKTIMRTAFSVKCDLESVNNRSFLEST